MQTIRVRHQDANHQGSSANPSGFVVEHIVEIVVRPGKVGLAGLDPSADRDAGLVHGFGASRNQPVPPVEVMPLRDQPIGAGPGQPADGAHILRRQPDTVRNPRQPVGIVGTAAAFGVEQPATDARPVDFAGILVLQLRQTAFAAAVAKRFPLGRRHRLERLGFPEWRTHCADVAPAGAEVKRGSGINETCII